MKLILVFLLFALPVYGQSQPDWPQYEELAVSLLRDYLRVDTSNPPGNELRAARFLEQALQREGIPSRVFEFAPGRANLYARLRGDGTRRPLLLLNHMDVVTAEAERWKYPPFSGALQDGYLWGRGALDMKGEGIIQLVTFLMVHRERLPLKRDLIFLATSDEEVEGLGSAWMIQNQRELLDAEYVLTEGGENPVKEGKVKFFGIDVAEKAPLWLRLEAQGQPGHGSTPIADSAPNRLVRALARLLDWDTPIRLIPAVERFFRETAPLEPPERARKFREIREALKDPEFARQLSQAREYNHLLRNTLSLTMFQGSPQTNVIPARAWAQVDARLLPGEDPQAFLAEMKRVLADPGIQVTLISAFRPPNSSPTDSELYRLVEETLRRQSPGVPVVPLLLGGFTECQMFRSLGSSCYGFSPFVTTAEESATEHADDERVSVENVREGLRRYWEVVSRAVQ